MKRLLLIILVSHLFISVTAQLNLNKGNISPKKYHQEIDAEFVNGKLIVPANIGGIQTKFILDTGAPLCITKELQEKNNYRIIKTDSIIDANGKSHLTKIVNVDELKLGKLIYKNIPALVIDLSGTPLECFNTSGLVGSNLFRFGALQIDWEKEKVIIADSYKKLGLDKKDGSKLLVNTVQSSPYLTVNVNATITDRLLIDTGSDDFYTFSKKGLDYVQSKGYLTNAVKYESKGCSSIGLFGPDTVGSNKLVKMDSLTISKMAHLHEFYAVTTNDDQSRVGVFLLKQGITTIDFKKGLFFFKLYSNKFKYDYFSFGFDVINDDGKIVVGSVWKDSDACKQGIRVGDEVIDIEGFDLESKSLCDVFFQYKKFIATIENISIKVKNPKEDKIKLIKLERMKL